MQGDAHRQLGTILMRLGEYDDALAAFDTALGYGVANPQQVHYLGGLIEGSREQWPDAIDKFRQAVDIDVSFTMAHVHLGRSLAEAGHFDEAQSAFAWADRLATHPQEINTARRRLAVLSDTELEGTR
jgi:tetratricopeptide (TPR) repeat protein